MIFGRRALQRRVSELRASLNTVLVDKLAARLNRHGKDRLAAMWELVVLHALARQGSIRSEDPLRSGRRPDIAFFCGELRFTADVTIVSDDGVNEQNPIAELSMRVEALKKRLGLTIGGLELQVHSRRERVGRHERVRLRLPDYRALDKFVRERLEPELRAQIGAGQTILKISIDDDIAGINLIIDPSKTPYSTAGYAAYAIPTVEDRNPLYNVLRAKARQLRTAEGITGIVVGDTGSTALRDRPHSWNDVDARGIAREFLRQHSSVGFVFILSVREEETPHLGFGQPMRFLRGILEIGKNCPAGIALDALFRSALSHMPTPVAMPLNGAHRAKEPGYGWGHHGGDQMSKGRVRISSRELMELLAGQRTIAELNEMHGWRSTSAPPSSQEAINPFDRSLKEGRLPAAVTVIRTDENDVDDWIEFEFGDPDSAISPIR